MKKHLHAKIPAARIALVQESGGRLHVLVKVWYQPVEHMQKPFDSTQQMPIAQVKLIAIQFALVIKATAGRSCSVKY
jgi:hypothetical protein